jgi:thioredoxin-related protein
MKKIILVSFTVLSVLFSFAQDLKNFKLYKPEENAEQEISAAIKKAKAEKKQVFIQIGGNWCIWCARFNDFVTTDKKIDSLIHSDYITYHLNYSKENYNVALLAKYGYPQRFGFPVFLIINEDGKLIHTQDSWYLEDGAKSYNKEKILSFLSNWNKKAFDPSQYKEQ